MEIKCDLKNFNPTYFRSLLEENKKRDNIPVDFACMHLNYCKEHPIDLLFNAISKATAEGKYSCSFGRNVIYKNFTDEAYEIVEKTNSWTEGILWWKKEFKETYTEDVKAHMRDVMVNNIMHELDILLWNSGFNVRSTTAAQAGCYPEDNTVITFNISW